jgi:hypothetical protein
MSAPTPAENCSVADADALFTRYRLIRDEIVHEDGLIGQRLGWFLASQAFLLAALATANGSERRMPAWSTNYFFPLIPLVAILSCLLIFGGLLAGVATLQRWRRLMKTPEYHNILLFPRVARDAWIIRLGWAAPVALPVIFLVAWAYLLVQGIGR